MIANHDLRNETINVNGCWEWQRARGRDGYGRVQYQGWLAMAHRLQYAKTRGVSLESIQGQVVMHLCDNPCCIMPMHLALGSQADNVADRVAKGRSARGEAHHTTTLTRKQAAEIRECKGAEFQRVTAARFGTTQATVSNIQRGATWSTEVTR